MRAPSPDEGGDAACWAHLLDEPTEDITGRADVERFVRDFYRQAAMDGVLGPVFMSAQLDWNAHIRTLVDFWSWQLFGDRTYEGNPLRAHEPAHRRTPFTEQHYERWLELFEGTVRSMYVGPTADLAVARARKMATAMRRLLIDADRDDDAETAVTFARNGRPDDRNG